MLFRSYSIGDVHLAATQDECVKSQFSADRPTRRLNVRRMMILGPHDWQGRARAVAAHNADGVLKMVLNQCH